MWHSTQGIVFHALKYADSGLIVKIYTELFGLQSYLVRGVRKSSSKIKTGFFQPLTLLSLEVSHREKTSLQNFRDIQVAVPYRTIPFDIRKSSIALYINELVYKTIREEEPNPALFNFIRSQCLTLDEAEQQMATFHIRFTFELMHFLGFYPRMDEFKNGLLFNLREGTFQEQAPDHPDYLDRESSRLFHALSPEGTEIAMYQPVLQQKHWILETLMIYYRMHLPGFKGVESLGVLKEVFGGSSR